jgi:hypothetical protein
VAMVQTDGVKRQVYTKLREYQRMCKILTSTHGEGEFRHNNGELSTVRLQAAGLGTKRVRLANIPPEVSDRVIKMVLKRYGAVKEIHAETWSKAYRFPVDNGIRAAVVTLVEHIYSHLLVAGHMSLVSFEGQPPTCYGCNDTGHICIECSNRRRVEEVGWEARSV